MTLQSLPPAVFLDRDGTINRDREDFVKSLEEFELLPQAIRAISAISRSEAKIIVVSNQSGIARGLFALPVLDAMTRRMKEAAEDAGGRIDGVYYCPHGPEDRCDCRKPLPGSLHRAAREMHLDLSRSVMIGDSYRDILAGNAAGCRATILVRTGKAPGNRIEDGMKEKIQPDLIADTLEDAVPWILRVLAERTPLLEGTPPISNKQEPAHE